MSECLYRWFDNDGQLLYIGISSGIGGRIKGHQRFSDWANKAAFITLEWYESRYEVERQEKLAIEKERPRQNKIFNTSEGEPRYHPPIATWREVEGLKKEVAFHKQLWDRQMFLDRPWLQQVKELRKTIEQLQSQPRERIFIA